MKPPRNLLESRTPVNSFGPELMAALKAGSESSVSILLPSKALAIRFCFRINSLRAAMRREEHPLATHVMRAGARIDPENRCRVIIAPRDSEFKFSLNEAKINVDPQVPQSGSAPDATPVPYEDSVSPSVDPADSFLSTLGPSAKKVD